MSSQSKINGYLSNFYKGTKNPSLDAMIYFMEEFNQLVSNVGFPIVACVFMFINNKELNKTIIDLTTTLKGIDTRLTMLEEKMEG